ncbi:MAG: elongation factor G, partial [Albidovulum sp.]|nr:elongation factor G [Albidovulum sp.]
MPFSFLGEDWTALDCPGSLEFAQSALDAAVASDAVVIVASPDPDHAVLAAPWIRIAERCETPHLVFVNRMDECHDRVRDIIDALQAYSKQPIILRQVPIREEDAIVGSIDLVSERAWQYRSGEPSELIEIPESILDRRESGREEMLESLSEHDDWLIEEIILDRVPATDAVYKICSRVLAENAVVPGFFGAASEGSGIRRLVKALRHEAPKPNETRARLGGATAAAFMTRTRKHLGKLVWIRNFGDTIKTSVSLGGGAIGGLVEPFGERPSAIPLLETGGVASAVKSEHLDVGNLYNEDGTVGNPEWYSPLSPVWKRAIRVKNEKDDAKLSEVLQKIGNEDPSIAVIHDQETGQIVLGTQGNQHLRRIQRKLEETFDIGTEAEPVIASYRETISANADVHFRHKKQSGGAGQFADVRLTVAPAPRGEGFSFTESIHGGAVPRNYIPAVRNGSEEAMVRGPLGFPVIDVKVNLYDGQHHSVDSSDMAFRIAG